MNELESLRCEIDRIDKQLLPLFLERMEVCGRVADYKREAGMPVLDAVREAQVLENKMSLLDNDSMKSEVYEFFNTIMTISRVRQNKILFDTKERVHSADILKQSLPKKENPKVVYFGSEGAYSEEAAIGVFGEDSDRFYAKTFEDAFLALSEDRADYAVLPIENSSTGTIADVADLLAKYEYYIVGEIYIPIRHCLMGVSGATLSDIKTVYSHEQAILQSREFLKTLNDIQCETYHSTALSAKAVSESGDKTKAAIAAKRNAKLYNLEILAEGINSSQENTTRFAVISVKPEVSEKSNKISAVFKLKHESGQLSRILTSFARGGLNLLKLESRPIPESPFEYRFFVDYTGSLFDENVRSITDTAMSEVESFTLLGNYETYGR